MNEESREALCASCTHREVCSLKETYLKAQEAVNQAIISEPYLNDEGKPATKMTYVANLRDWLTIPQLKCRHYKKETLTRNLEDPCGQNTFLKG